jgi:hypothetical protein
MEVLTMDRIESMSREVALHMRYIDEDRVMRDLKRKLDA